MKLQEYLELIELAKNDIYTHKQRREKALSHKDELEATKGNFIKSILRYKSWNDKRYTKFSSNAMSHLQNITLILSLVAIVVGFATGVGLLSYSGKEPINVIYFMFVSIFLPLLSSIFVLVSLFSSSTNSLLVKLSPAFWLEKIVSKFLDKHKQGYEIDKSVYKYLVIQRGVLLSILFYIAMLLALLMVVTTQDIAFAWSTTLNISSVEFAKVIHFISQPWKDIAPYAVPSQELIEASRLFRLGAKLSSDMIQHASTLGEWWKFLAFGVLFYAIFLRFLLYILSSWRLQKAIKNSLQNNKVLKNIVEDIHTPIISTTAQEQEVVKDRTIKVTKPTIDTNTDVEDSIVFGWDISQDILDEVSKKYSITYKQSHIVGSVDSLDMDSEILSTIDSSLILIVKAWEPPVGDLWDFLEEIPSSVEVTLLLAGTKAKDYQANQKDIDIWSRQLQKQSFDNVRLRYE